jgi:hypothetical protein
MGIVDNVSVGIYISESFIGNCNTLKNTFLKHFKNYLFLGSKEDLSIPCYTHEKVEGDDYSSATSKKFLSLKKQFEIHNSCDWFYVGGFDIFLHPQNIKNLLSNYNSQEPFYIGGHQDYRIIENEQICFCSGGPGMFLSKKLLEIIYPNLESYIKRWKNPNLHSTYVTYAGCDVALAYFLKKDHNIIPTLCPGFYHFNYTEYLHANKNTYPEGYHLHYELISEPIAFHSIKTIDMQKDLYTRAINGQVPFDKCEKLSIIDA